METVTIAIVVRNNLNYTKQCLESIFKNTDYPKYRVVIVNNDSNDGTVGYLSSIKMPDGIKGSVIHNSSNKSFSITNNQAREIAEDGYFLLLNNDTIVTPGWLTALVNCFEEEENVGVVGAKLIFPGSGGVQHAGVEITRFGTPDHAFFKYDPESFFVDKRREFPAVTGACLMTKTSIWDEVGGLDERYVFGYEDIHFCNQVREKGYKIFYEPKAVLYHYGSQTPGRFDYENSNYNVYAEEWIHNGKYKKDVEEVTYKLPTIDYETTTKNTNND